MTSHPLAPRRPRPDLFPGQAVHVNARAAWLPATVISVAHTTRRHQPVQHHAGRC